MSVWGRCQPRTWPAATLKGSLQDGPARPAEPATSGDLSPLKRGWEAARVPLREGNEHCFPSQGRREEGRGFPSTPEAPSACSPRPERCPAWGRPRLRVGDSETLARWATGRRAARRRAGRTRDRRTAPGGQPVWRRMAKAGEARKERRRKTKERRQTPKAGDGDGKDVAAQPRPAPLPWASEALGPTHCSGRESRVRLVFTLHGLFGLYHERSSPLGHTVRGEL